MGKEIPPFSFSAGERKIMAHFVVKCLFLLWLRHGRTGLFVVNRLNTKPLHVTIPSGVARVKLGKTLLKSPCPKWRASASPQTVR